MRTRWAAGAVAALLVLTGCTDDAGDLMEQQEQQNAELRERPTSEAEVARLAEAQAALVAALEADLGLGPWTVSEGRGSSGCPQYDQSDGEIHYLEGLLLTGGVPDAVWPRAADLVADIGGRYDFGPADVVVDAPGEHEIVLRGADGALLRFGTLKNATLQLATGCHLPERELR